MQKAQTKPMMCEATLEIIYYDYLCGNQRDCSS